MIPNAEKPNTTKGGPKGTGHLKTFVAEKKPVKPDLEATKHIKGK